MSEKIPPAGNIENVEKEKIKGTRNLLVLGLGALGIALVATVISIWIYYETGDIYIDRSRPGFLAEEDGTEELMTETGEYALGETGEFTAEVLAEYLENLQAEIDKLDTLEDTFGTAPLSDESLGIKASGITTEETDE